MNVFCVCWQTNIWRLVRWGGKIKYHLTAYFLSNISAKNYQNQLMYVEVKTYSKPKQCRFLRHSLSCLRKREQMLTRCSRRRQTSPQCRHLVNWTKIRVVFDSGPFTPLYKNMMSSTKPEVHNLLHCRQRMTEPRRLVTCTEWNLNVWFLRYVSGKTDKQTLWLQYFAPLLAAK